MKKLFIIFITLSFLFAIAASNVTLAETHMLKSIKLMAVPGLENPSSLIVTDINQDRLPDLILAASQGYAYPQGAIHILTQKADDASVSFVHRTLTEVRNPAQIATFNISGNHRPEILAWSESNGLFYWYELTNKGDKATLHELDFDNIPKPAKSNYFGQTAQLPDLCGFSGDVTRRQFAEISQISLVDVDKDGDLDILSAMPSPEGHLQSPVAVFLNRKGEQFTATCLDQSQIFWGIQGFDYISGKGSKNKPTFFILSLSGKNVELETKGIAKEPSSGQPYVETRASFLPPTPAFDYRKIIKADLNQDNRVDLIYVGARTELHFKQDGASEYQIVKIPMGTADLVVIEDLNQDSLPELVLAPVGEFTKLTLLISTDTPGQYTRLDTEIELGFGHLSVVDLDQDGLEDVVAVSQGGQVWWLRRE